MQVKMSEVQEGDYLTGLDNGYVVEVEKDPDVSMGVGRGTYAAMGSGMVMLTFHDAEGGEGYLMAAADMPVEVKR